MKITRFARLGQLLLGIISAILLGLVIVQGPFSTTASAQDAPEAPPAESAEATTATPADGEEIEFKLDWIAEVAKGGVISLFLGLLSILGLGFFLDRFFNVRESSFAPEKLHKQVLDLSKKQDMHAVLEVAKKHKSIYAAVVRFLVTNKIENIDEANVVAADIAGRGMKDHQQRAYMLMVVASVAPLLGLLGTVIGMIEAFGVVAVAGSMGDASILADSISKALITTALGLTLAIPFLMLYHYFRQKTSKFGTLLEERVTELLYLWFKS